MVSLRDGKTYDPSADASTGTSRRRSNATASAQRPRRSARLAQISGSVEQQGDDDNVPFRATEEDPVVVTPARNKRQRQPQLSVLPEPAPDATPAAAEGSDDLDDLDTYDIGSTDQGVQVQDAADMELPADEPSPSAMHANKKPRIPTSRTPTPSKAAKAAIRPRHEALVVSMAAVVMVLVAAAAAALLLPGLAPHRQQLKENMQQTAAYTNQAYVQPLKLWASDSLVSASAQLSAASAVARQQLQQAQLRVQETWGRAGTREQAVQSSGAWSADTLSSILPDGAVWASMAADIAEHLQLPAPQRNHKAPALLLACASDDDCNEAAAALAVLPPKGEACTLSINSPDLEASAADSTSQPAAALQALLAPFLRRCPAGLVVLRASEELPPAAVPALHNAISELGGFQHDGTVDGSKAAYVLLLQLHPTQVAMAAAAPDSAAADQAIKEAFFNILSARLEAAAAAQPSNQWGAVERSISTLHRRIEFAAPVRLGTSSEAVLDALDAAAVEEQEGELHVAHEYGGAGDDAVTVGSEELELVLEESAGEALAAPAA